MGTRLAEIVVERTDALRGMDDFLGGDDMHDLLRRELRATLELVRSASYTEKAGQLLLGAVGELCQLAGWVASDAGLYDLATRYYRGGVSAAHAADDKPLAVNLLSSLTCHVANVGDAHDSVLLACTAYHGAEKAASTTTRALLLERLAWANARFGDSQASHARELALYLSWLAEAHAYNGSIEEAAATALRALHLAGKIASARSNDRIKVLRRTLKPYRGNATVDEFEEHAAEVLDRIDG